jgi:hypothetical protein
MLKSDASASERAEYQRLLRLRPQESRVFGDLAVRAQDGALKAYKALPMLEADIAHRLQCMRGELAGPSPSPLELLLIDVILCSYQDFFEFQLCYKQKTIDGFKFADMEQWERILASKAARYIRAVESLARVRKLLNLQININMPGGQQVNVQGKP